MILAPCIVLGCLSVFAAMQQVFDLLHLIVRQRAEAHRACVLFHLRDGAHTGDWQGVRARSFSHGLPGWICRRERPAACDGIIVAFLARVSMRRRGRGGISRSGRISRRRTRFV